VGKLSKQVNNYLYALCCSADKGNVTASNIFRTGQGKFQVLAIFADIKEIEKIKSPHHQIALISFEQQKLSFVSWLDPKTLES